MKHLIELDDTTNIGKTILNLVQTISIKNKGIVFLEEENDTVSFDVFAKQLREAVNKKLGAKKKSGK
jgi:hypothetical protein